MRRQRLQRCFVPLPPGFLPEVPGMRVGEGGGRGGNGEDSYVSYTHMVRYTGNHMFICPIRMAHEIICVL